MAVNKFQTFITVGLNSLSFHKVFHDTTEINNALNLINKNIWNLVRNNFYQVNYAYLIS